MATFNLRKPSVEERASQSPYPAELMQEYHTLTDKKVRRTISKEDADRLTEVRAIITQIDADLEEPDIWDRQAIKLREELSQLRAEVDALPDAASKR